MRFLRFVILTFILLCIFGFGIFMGKILPRSSQKNTAEPQIQTTATVLKEIQTLSQLVTVKYVLEKVVVLEDVKWYGENRVLLVAHGIVKAGVDFQKLDGASLEITKDKLTITLPPPVITDVYLDDKKTRVLERSTGVMRVFDKDLEQNARRQAVDDLKFAARNNGILKEAGERARDQLTTFFKHFGFREVEIREGNNLFKVKKD